MNLSSHNVFRGALVSVCMGADDNDWLLIDNVTSEPILMGNVGNIFAEYDKRNGKVDKLEG